MTVGICNVFFVSSSYVIGRYYSHMLVKKESMYALRVQVDTDDDDKVL